eukprot:403376335
MKSAQNVNYKSIQDGFRVDFNHNSLNPSQTDQNYIYNQNANNSSSINESQISQSRNTQFKISRLQSVAESQQTSKQINFNVRLRKQTANTSKSFFKTKNEKTNQQSKPQLFQDKSLNQIEDKISRLENYNSQSLRQHISPQSQALLIKQAVLTSEPYQNRNMFAQQSTKAKSLRPSSSYSLNKSQAQTNQSINSRHKGKKTQININLHSKSDTLNVSNVQIEKIEEKLELIDNMLKGDKNSRGSIRQSKNERQKSLRHKVTKLKEAQTSLSNIQVMAYDDQKQLMQNYEPEENVSEHIEFDDKNYCTGLNSNQTRTIGFCNQTNRQSQRKLIFMQKNGLVTNLSKRDIEFEKIVDHTQNQSLQNATNSVSHKCQSHKVNVQGFKGKKLKNQSNPQLKQENQETKINTDIFNEQSVYKSLPDANQILMRIQKNQEIKNTITYAIESDKQSLKNIDTVDLKTHDNIVIKMNILNQKYNPNFSIVGKSQQQAYSQQPVNRDPSHMSLSQLRDSKLQKLAFNPPLKKDQNQQLDTQSFRNSDLQSVNSSFIMDRLTTPGGLLNNLLDKTGLKEQKQIITPKTLIEQQPYMQTSNSFNRKNIRLQSRLLNQQKYLSQGARTHNASYNNIMNQETSLNGTNQTDVVNQTFTNNFSSKQFQKQQSLNIYDSMYDQNQLNKKYSSFSISYSKPQHYSNLSSRENILHNVLSQRGMIKSKQTEPQSHNITIQGQDGLSGDDLQQLISTQKNYQKIQRQVYITKSKRGSDQVPSNQSFSNEAYINSVHMKERIANSHFKNKQQKDKLHTIR